MSEFSIYDELMPKIKSLISPSDYGNKEKCAPDQHPFYKKRGRRHNHDHCDACGEKGNLLCCEICPASFHLLCHDPPLVGKNLPSDTWHCRACNIIMGKNMAHLINSLNKNSNTSDRNVEIRIPEISHMLNKVRNNFMEERDIVRVDSCTNELNDAETKSEKSVGTQSSEYEINSFIRIRNEESSTQYFVNGNSDIEIIEIKSESTSSDDYSSETIKNTSNESKDLHKFTNVSINLPKCDNLLNSTGLMHASTDSSFNQIKKPPGTTVMSINEVFAEVIKEAKKMNPKQFALPIEYIANINLNVIGSEKDPDTFRNDIDSNDLLKLPPRRCFYCNGICLTGEMISCDFCPGHFHLNCLNPPLCSVTDVRWMCPLHPHHILDKVMTNSSSITEFSSWWDKLSVPIDDENVKIDFINRVKKDVQKKPSLQLATETAMNIPEIVKYYYNNPPTKIPTTLKDLLDSTQICVFDSDFILTPHNAISKSNDCCDEIKVRETIPSMDTSSINGACITVNDINESDFDLNPISSGTLIEIISDDINTKHCGHSNGKENNECSEDLSTWDKKSRRFKFKSIGIYDYESLVKTNFQRRISPNNVTRNKLVHESLPSIIRSDSCKGNPWQRIRQIVDKDLEENFRSYGSMRSRIDPHIKKYMIDQKMHMLVRNLCPSLLPNTLPYPFFPPRSDDGHWQLLPDPPKSKVRAVLCPLSHRAPLIYMYRSTLNIGTDFSNDVCLVNYGRCNFGSGEHAVIYYDKITNVYELLNYSEYGTFVDGLCYCCNWASKNNAKKNSVNFTNNEERRNKTITDTDNQAFDEDRKDKMNRVVERKTRERSVGSDDGTEVKRRGSAVAAVETRNTYKKLLHDIDKLVVSSQKEMTSIADEDLNEISKLVKLGREALNGQRESSVGKPNLKKKCESFSGTIKKRKTIVKTSDSDCVKLVDDPPVDETDPVADQTNKRCGELIDGAAISTKRRRESKSFKFESVESIGLKENSVMRRFRRRPKYVFANRKPKMEKRTDTSSHNQVNEETLSSESDRDFEYMGKMKGNGGEKKCRCQLLNLKLPIGRDSSWERAAPLHHGSYIRFGCLEFIFSIINYSAPIDERINKERLKTRSPSPAEAIKERKATSPLKEISKSKTQDDLSTKLISILNVLSTPRSSRSSPSGTPETSDSSGTYSRSSPMSSRSISPVESANSITKINRVFEINHEELE